MLEGNLIETLLDFMTCAKSRQTQDSSISCPHILQCDEDMPVRLNLAAKLSCLIVFGKSQWSCANLRDFGPSPQCTSFYPFEDFGISAFLDSCYVY